MSSPCVQSFSDPLSYDSQTNILSFVDPNSLSHHSSPRGFHSTSSSSTSTASSTCDYNSASYMKQRDNQTRFRYADLLSNSNAPDYDSTEPCYLPISSSSPSNDSSDDYHHPSSNEPNARQGDPMSSFMDPSSAAVAAAVGGVGQPSFFMNLQSSSPDSTSSSGLLPPPTTASILSSLHPFSMASPSPTVDLHHLQQHRHSIAAPSSHHLNSYYDPVQRHHSFSHPTNMFNSTQQGEARGTASPATTMIQSFANLCTSRPVTPVSPLMPLSPGMNTGLSKEDCHGLMNDLCFPPVFAMSPHNGMADLRRRSLPTESKAEKTKSTRSRGRRVSNVPSNGARMFTCKVDGCGKVFKRSEHLKRHIRSIHTLEKPFECPYQSCNKRFSRSDNLNQHIRIHRHSTASASHKEKQPKSNGASSAVAEHPQQQFASFVQNYNV